MARTGWSSVTRRKHKAVLKAVKGHKGARSRRLRVAKESLIHAQHYATVHRRLKKRQMRSLAITRINAAARQFGISYSQLIGAFKAGSIELDRYALASLAVNNLDDFGKLVKTVSSSEE